MNRAKIKGNSFIKETKKGKKERMEEKKKERKIEIKKKRKERKKEKKKERKRKEYRIPRRAALQAFCILVGKKSMEF